MRKLALLTAVATLAGVDYHRGDEAVRTFHLGFSRAAGRHRVRWHREHGITAGNDRNRAGTGHRSTGRDLPRNRRRQHRRLDPTMIRSPPSQDQSSLSAQARPFGHARVLKRIDAAHDDRPRWEPAKWNGVR